MELKLDFDKFDELQRILIHEIVETTMVKLMENGLEGQQLEDATASVVFSIASIIDDTTRIESNDIEVKPYLTFRGSDEELIHCGENSYTYDLTMGAMKKVFHSK